MNEFRARYAFAERGAGQNPSGCATLSRKEEGVLDHMTLRQNYFGHIRPWNVLSGLSRWPHPPTNSPAGSEPLKLPALSVPAVSCPQVTRADGWASETSIAMPLSMIREDAGLCGSEAAVRISDRPPRQRQCGCCGLEI